MSDATVQIVEPADPAEVVIEQETEKAAVDVVAEEVLVEEISIDGMCGVY